MHSYPFGHRRTLHHADLYRLDSTGDVDDLALDELAEFGGIVLVEWGDVVGGFGDHLEVRLSVPDDIDDLDDLDRDPDAASDDSAGGADAVASELLAAREIEIAATGSSWAGRWERLATALAGYRV